MPNIAGSSVEIEQTAPAATSFGSGCSASERTALVRLRILSAARLRATWRFGVFLMTVIGVILPGVDPVSTILSVIPLVGLYLLSIGLATFLEPRWRAEAGTTPVPE